VGVVYAIKVFFYHVPMLVLPSESFGGGPGEPVGVVAGPRSRLLALLRGVFGPKSLVQPLSDPTRHRHIGQPSHTPTDSSARADADSPGTGDATTVSTRVPSRPRSRRGGGHLAPGTDSCSGRHGPLLSHLLSSAPRRAPPFRQ
jgi:hypothetical protein